MKSNLMFKLIVKAFVWIMMLFLGIWPILLDLHVVHSMQFVGDNNLILMSLFLLYTTTNAYKKTSFKDLIS